MGRINKYLGSCLQDKILTYRCQFYSIYQQQIYKMKMSKVLFAQYKVPRIKCSLVGKKKKERLLGHIKEVFIKRKGTP